MQAKVVVMVCVIGFAIAEKTPRFSQEATRYESNLKIKAEDTLVNATPTEVTKSGENLLEWVTLFSDDFEDCDLSPWIVVDGNGDGYTWECGATGGLRDREPHNYGTAYAYYSTILPTFHEDLISPPINIAGYDSIRATYTWAHGLVLNFFLEVYYAIDDNWILYTIYDWEGNCWDTIVVTTIGASTFQLMFRYEELYYGWGVSAVDNIKVEGWGAPDFLCTSDSLWHRKEGSPVVFESFVHGRYDTTLTNWKSCLFVREVTPGQILGTRWDTSFCVEGAPLNPGELETVVFDTLYLSASAGGLYHIIDSLEDVDGNRWFEGAMLDQQVVPMLDHGYYAGWIFYTDWYPQVTHIMGNLWETYAVGYFPKDLGGRIDSVALYVGTEQGRLASVNVQIYDYYDAWQGPGAVLFDTTCYFSQDTFLKVPVPSLMYGGEPFYVAVKLNSDSIYIGIDSIPPVSAKANCCMLKTHWKREPEWIWEWFQVGDLYLWSFVRGWKCGDVNANGEVTASDAILILGWIGGEGEIGSSTWNANVNGDSVVSSPDAIGILLWLAGEFELNCQPVED